jgi:hypothetical protein
MGKRYVPKTYYNRRLLRVILGTIVSVALAIVIMFVLLFFVLEEYYEDGRLQIPWLTSDTVPAAPTD